MFTSFINLSLNFLPSFLSGVKFLQFKEFELYWGAVFFFKICLHIHDFWSQIGVVILVTPKQEMERKSKWFCGVNFFRSNFKVEWENGVWTKIRFLASGFLFTCGNFTLISTVFRIFGSDFFLSGFPNLFTAHSRPSFLFELYFHFSLVVFWFICGILTLIFCFLLFFIWLFKKNGFLNSLIVHSRSSFSV